MEYDPSKIVLVRTANNELFVVQGQLRIQVMAGGEGRRRARWLKEVLAKQGIDVALEVDRVIDEEVGK